MSGKPERGHLSSCGFTNNLDPGNCDCDGLLGMSAQTQALATSLNQAGWKTIPCIDPMWPSFGRKFGRHRVVFSRCASGWQYRWMRGEMTIEESSSFGSVEACLDSLWNKIGVVFDQLWEERKEALKKEHG